MRGTIRKIADKEDYKMPATIDDPAILTEITDELIKNNILKKWLDIGNRLKFENISCNSQF